jgi:hypothetical protein
MTYNEIDPDKLKDLFQINQFTNQELPLLIKNGIVQNSIITDNCKGAIGVVV